MKKGIIVSFEGIDGCGKTTLSQKFYNYLIKKKYNAVLLHEPGGTKIGEEIRKLLLKRDEKLNRYTELFLYIASRIELIEKKIKKYLKEGKIVVLDRYIDSTFAYQGYGRKIPLKYIKDLHRIFMDKEFFPDITFLIDEKPENLVKILNNKKIDRIEKESIEFQRKIREGYLKLAGKNKRIKVIKRGTLENTFKNILEIWEDFLNETRRHKENTFKSKRQR
jgi:dTMP kinase